MVKASKKYDKYNFLTTLLLSGGSLLRGQLFNLLFKLLPEF